MHAALDGELAPQSWADLQRHLSRCPACAREWRQHQALAGGWQWLAANSEAPSADVAHRPQPSPSGSPVIRRRVWWYGSAAAAVLVLGLSLFWLRRSDRGETVIVADLPSGRAAEEAAAAAAGGEPVAAEASRGWAPQAAGAPLVDVQLVGESIQKYIALPQPSGRPQVHLVWLYPTRSPPGTGLPAGGGSGSL
jgi:anti-sigma factor RsiW